MDRSQTTPELSSAGDDRELLPGLLPIAFTGAPGAYSEQAARRYFGPGATTLTCPSAVEALARVAAQQAGGAVFPVENTVTGGYEHIVEALTGLGPDLAIVGELSMPIRHCLLAAPGARLSELREVVSHPSALVHCRDWLANWGVSTREATDTAEAAREVAQSGDLSIGVLGSRSLAELYPLELVAEGLSDLPHNETRFWVAGPAGSENTGTPSPLPIGPVTAPRVLKTLRIQLEAHGTSRTRAPFLCSADATGYLVEFDHPEGAGTEIAERACDGLPNRLLGCWTP